MRLALVVFAVVVLGSTPAGAEDLVVLPPLGAAKDTAPVSAALTKSGISVAALKVDATCAGDPGCLAKKGGELSANRIVAITVAAGGKLDIVVVDVGAKVLLGTRT